MQVVAGVLCYAIQKHGEKTLHWKVKKAQKISSNAETDQHSHCLIIVMVLALFWTIQISSHQFQCHQSKEAFFLSPILV